MYVEDVISMDSTVVAESACTNDFGMCRDTLILKFTFYNLKKSNNGWLIQQFGNDVHKRMVKI